MVIGYYAGLLALLYVFLMMRVARMRWKYKVGIGDGGEHELNKAIRVHANCSENVPFAVILIFILESQSVPDLYIHALGGSLLVARILHGYGLTKTSKTSFGRGVGAALTATVIGVSGLILIYKFLAPLYF